MKRVVLVLEGGAAKIPVQVGVLQQIEGRTGKPIRDLVDLIVSTSAGTVNASIICRSEMKMSKYAVILLDNIPKIFKKRFGVPKFRFSSYMDLYNNIVGPCLFGEAKIPAVFTTVNMLSGQNEFLKSDKTEDASVPMTSQACKSFAAPYFFGGWDDPAEKKVFLDGGTGLCNLPLLEAYVEVLKRGWLEQPNSIHVLAIGCGRHFENIQYDKAVKGGILKETARQLDFFMDFQDGGAARTQSTMYQVNTMACIAKYTPNLTFQWIDWSGMPKKLDKFDNVGARFEYYQKGLELGTTVDIDLLSKGEIGA